MKKHNKTAQRKICEYQNKDFLLLLAAKKGLIKSQDNLTNA